MPDRKALDRSAIFVSTMLPVEPVEVPEWGGTIYVRTLSGAERDAFEMSCMPKRDGREPRLQNLRARLVALCACDENGRRIFSDDDAGTLGELSSLIINRIFEAAQKLNGMGAGSTEEAKKN